MYDTCMTVQALPYFTLVTIHHHGYHIQCVYFYIMDGIIILILHLSVTSVM